MTDNACGPLYATLFMAGLIYNLSEVAFNNSSVVAICVWLVAIHYRLDMNVGVSAEVAEPTALNPVGR